MLRAVLTRGHLEYVRNAQQRLLCVAVRYNLQETPTRDVT